MHNILRKLFGWHQYRIKFIYQDKNNGRVIFTITKTVGLSQRKFIDDHRKIKKELGPIYNVANVPRHLLNNGTMMIEPTCYLGRWN